MSEALTPDNVQTALDAKSSGLKVQILNQSSATAPEAAAALNTEVGSIVKSLVFMVALTEPENAVPVVVLTAGDKRVDDRKIAAIYEVSRKKVKIATPEQCVEFAGYLPGGVPPVGHRHDNLTIFIDETLSRYETVYAAAGAHNAIFPVPYQQLIDITGGKVVDIVKEG